MGEIKSTLDLVLEKTKHLSLSEKEKKEQKQRELEAKVGGLLSKFQDEIIRKEQLHNDLADLKEAHGFSDYAFLSNEIAERLALDADNRLLFNLLEEFSSLSTAGFELIQKEYREAVQSATQESAAKALQALKEEHGISGSALVPNLEASDAWRIEAQRIKDSFQKKLDEERSRFRGE